MAGKKPVKFFLCSFCGAKIMNSEANLIRHETIHSPFKKRIKCSADGCDSTFAEKSCYHVHWKSKHNHLIMPDGYVYLNGKTRDYRMKFNGTNEECAKNEKPPSPKSNEFPILNYLELHQGRNETLILTLPYNGPFFGKLIWDEPE